MPHCRPLEDGNILRVAGRDNRRNNIGAAHGHPGGSHARIMRRSLCHPARAHREETWPTLGTGRSTWPPRFLAHGIVEDILLSMLAWG